MRIQLATSAGFCFGVKNAIKKALDALASGNKIVMLGDIVHNRTVVENMREKGIRKISRLGKGKGKTLLIRAHGAPLVRYSKAKSNGYFVIDATCPMVKEIHNIAKKDEADGRSIIIIGDRDHDEVKGIKGNISSKALIIDPSLPFPEKKVSRLERAGIVIQSTQNPGTVIPIIERLKEIIPDVLVHDTICKPTRERQKEAREIPPANDIVFIIGSAHSANTRRLYEISRSLNPRTYRINSVDDIQQDHLKDAGSAGILAGASTPNPTIKAVVDFLKAYPAG